MLKYLGWVKENATVTTGAVTYGAGVVASLLGYVHVAFGILIALLGIVTAYMGMVKKYREMQDAEIRHKKLVDENKAKEKDYEV